MLEAEWQAKVVEPILRMYNWTFYHTHDSRRSEAGFPDLVAMRRTRLLVAELKIGKRQPTPAQQKWLDMFTIVGAEVYVWSPGDENRIVQVLKR